MTSEARTEEKFIYDDCTYARDTTVQYTVDDSNDINVSIENTSVATPTTP